MGILHWLWFLTNNTKTKTNKNKLHDKNKQDKYLIYNSQYSFAKFKDSNDFKELSFDSIHKRLNELYKKFGRFKNFSPQKKEKGILKEKVLSNAGELFNELYYIYKNIYNKEKHLIKKSPLKNQQKLLCVNEWINKEKKVINRGLFQKHFKMQMPSDMLKALYTTIDKKKNSNLVNLIKSGLNE